MRAVDPRVFIWVIVVAAALLFAGPVAGYYFENKITWSGPVTMHLQLGPSEPLMDGASDWDQSAAEALELWNQHLKSPVQFKFVPNSTVAIRKADKHNNVFFSDDIFGEPFPAGVAAVTLLRWSGSKMSDADVVFNRALAYNAYRGPNRGSVIDFRRVALHEFGHVLGLNHPDVAGQSVTAIMNSYVGDTEEPQADDVEGVESIYGKVETRSTATGLTATHSGEWHAGLVGFPARGEIEAFGAALQARFKAGQRPAETTFVDMDNVALWTQEYVRYRVQACDHADAVERTFMQIEGLGVQPVCGLVAAVSLPERDELFDFRTRLEAKFRDDFRAHSTVTHVGARADSAWLQEYLRYRLGACDHQAASARTMDQLNRGGAAALCR